MITFFRRVRHHLLETGAVRKYILYAVGEVLLVMIGILLALQVNNWNEGRKDREIEKKVLKELEVSLHQNIQAMEEDIQRRIIWNRSSDIIIATMENGGNYVDSLNLHFQNARIPGTNLSLSLAGYEGLKNAGYNIIRSDTVRNNIVQLFEVTLRTFLEEMAYFESFQPDRQHVIDELFSYEEEKFDPESPFTVPIKPHDYDSLKDNLPFLAMVKSVKVQRNIIGVHLNRLLNASRQALRIIEEELNRKN